MCCCDRCLICSVFKAKVQCLYLVVARKEQADDFLKNLLLCIFFKHFSLKNKQTNKCKRQELVSFANKIN